MANITPTLTRATETASNDVWVASWALGNADQGLQVSMSGAADRSVQIAGTFGAATVIVEGSNDGTNWTQLSDTGGTAISKTATFLGQIMQLTRYIRCSSSGGTGTAIVVTLLMKGQTG
jgi:hypothetical protein